MSYYTVHSKDEFRFVDSDAESDRPPVVLLHGMLGGVENWTSTISAISDAGYRVVAPLLPVYDLPMSETSVSGLMSHTAELVELLALQNPVLVGNSLGGQVALLYALTVHSPERRPSALILTGSSGVDEVVMGESTPRRFDREYVKERAAFTFYDPRHASDELVDGVMDVVADRNRVVRLIKMARSSRDETVEDSLPEIRVPTLLIWGAEDRLTPPDTAARFKDLLQNARLELIPYCGHAPMIEHPGIFNDLVLDFLNSLEPVANDGDRLDASVT